MCWPKERPNDVIFGLAEGKIKSGAMRSNKSSVLFATESYCVALAANKEGDSFVSGHLDGSVYAFNCETSAAQKVVVHHSIPYA